MSLPVGYASQLDDNSDSTPVSGPPPPPPHADGGMKRVLSRSYLHHHVCCTAWNLNARLCYVCMNCQTDVLGERIVNVLDNAKFKMAGSGNRGLSVAKGSLQTARPAGRKSCCLGDEGSATEGGCV